MINYEVVAKQTKLMRNAQVVMTCMLSYAMFITVFQILIPVFISYSPTYRCNVAPLSDHINNESLILNYTTPVEDGEYNGCKRYGFDLLSCNSTSFSCVNKSAAHINCDNGYIYDKFIFTETVVTKFDLVCDRFYLKSFSTSMFEVGSLIGSFLFGDLGLY